MCNIFNLIKLATCSFMSQGPGFSGECRLVRPGDDLKLSRSGTPKIVYEEEHPSETVGLTSEFSRDNITDREVVTVKSR